MSFSQGFYPKDTNMSHQTPTAQDAHSIEHGMDMFPFQIVRLSMMCGRYLRLQCCLLTKSATTWQRPHKPNNNRLFHHSVELRKVLQQALRSIMRRKSLRVVPVRRLQQGRPSFPLVSSRHAKHKYTASSPSGSSQLQVDSSHTWMLNL